MLLLLILLALFGLAALIGTPIVGVILLEKNRTKSGGFVLGIYGLLIAAFLVTGVASKRSTPGRIIRWLSGESGAKHTVNDLAEDIRKQPTLAQIQPWGIETLAKFRSGQIHTNGAASYWSAGNIRLAAQERPEFITKEWGLTNSFGEEEPEISIMLSKNGQPECVVVAWYLYGIVVATPDYHLTFEPWYYAEAKPGVYVYHFYK